MPTNYGPGWAGSSPNKIDPNDLTPADMRPADWVGDWQPWQGTGVAGPTSPLSPAMPAVTPFAVARMTSQPFGIGQMSALQNMQRPGMNAVGGGMFGAPNLSALHPALYGRQQFAGGPHDILGWLQNRLVKQKPGMTPPGVTQPGTLPPGVAGP